MNDMSNFWLIFSIGLLVGIDSHLGFMLVFNELVFGENHDRFISKMFPSIFTAIFTSIGLIIALFGVYCNTKIQHNIENKRVERKLRAARASLPLALNEISNICKLHLLQIAHRGKYDTKDSMEISGETKETIRLVIEHSNDNIQHELSRLLAYYQFSVSCFNLFISDPPETGDDLGIDHEEIHLVLLWASLSAITTCLFDYGRGAKFELTDEKTLNAFQIQLMKYLHKYAYENKAYMAGKYNYIVLSRYIECEDTSGCGFLDPDFYKWGLNIS